MNTFAALVFTRVLVVTVGLSCYFAADSVVVNIDRLLCTKGMAVSCLTSGSKSRLSGLAEHSLSCVSGDSLTSIGTILIN